MYVLVRADLSPGLQVAQAVHAAFHFADAHPSVCAAWLTGSQTLVVLNVADETELLHWYDMAYYGHRIPHVLVREPDLGNAVTALCVGPSELNVHFANLPLAGRVPMTA